MSERWGLAAEFSHEDGRDNYTFYDEPSFASYEEARKAIDTEVGELIAGAASIDVENEPDLQGFNFEDIAPYLIEDDQDLS